MLADVIILSKGDTQDNVNMTQRCLDSLHESETDHSFVPRVYDKFYHDYKGCKNIDYDIAFHYNRLMNIGIANGNCEYIALCNNDLLFHRGWFSKCVEAMGNKYLSASPNHIADSDGVEEGYDIGVGGQVKGWCILIKRSLMDVIGSIDESVVFWYSDNVYVDQLKKHDVKHILVKGALVEHLESKTLKQVDDLTRDEYTTKQGLIYEQRRTKI
jgi:GT2 family glycosyltransferase